MHESWAPGPLPSLVSRRGATPLHSDGCHLPRPVRVAPPSLHTSHFQPITLHTSAPCPGGTPVTLPPRHFTLVLAPRCASGSLCLQSSGDGRNLDLRTVALLVGCTARNEGGNQHAMDLRTVALLVIGTHTPHHMTAHAAHGTPQCTPRRSSHHAAHGTLQFTRDRTRHLSGVWL